MALCLRTLLCGAATMVALTSAGGTGSAVGATPGLVAAYSFDVPNTVVDASGNGNTGTTTRTTWVSAGKYGGALSFDGKSSWVTVADSASLHFTSGFTVEAWVKPHNAGGSAWQAVAVKERTAGIVFGLYANSSRSQPAAVVTAGATEQTAFGTAAVSSAVWTHVAETFDAAAVRLYVNGTLVSTTLAAGSPPDSTSPLRFGGDAVRGEFFRGSIDEVRLYARPLAASEIVTDMNTRVDAPAPDTQPPTAPGTPHVTGSTATSITVAWTASTDNVGVSAYGKYLGGTLVGSTTATSTTFTGLACATSYGLAFDAVDAAGNRSLQSTLQAATSPCPDTTPPSTPGALVASSVGETSAALDWTASTDDVGVVGYGVYRDGTQVGSSTSTSATVSGLVCATSYSLGVDAVDAAGNRSPRATVPVTTAVCTGTGTGASFFVAPGGSDAGSCTSTAPCATFSRAITLAAPGQVVEVAAGSYPPQTISAVKAGPAPVVVAPAPGAAVSVTSLAITGAYVEFRSMSVTGGYDVTPPGQFVTFRDIHTAHAFIVGNDTTIVDGEIGPIDSCVTGAEDGLQIWQRNAIATTRVTVDHVYIHDVSDHDNGCAGFPNAGVHDDCVQILAGHFTTIRNSTFFNCPTSNVIARPFNDTLDHLTIEGNVLNPERRPGASLSIGSTGDTCANVVIQYNTAIDASSIFNCSTAMIVRGNIFPAPRGGACAFGLTPQYSYDVWVMGPACSATDRVCTPAFVDPTVRDFHLLATDTCAKDHGDPANFPATDLDGQSRPLGLAPDAGADEVG